MKKGKGVRWYSSEKSRKSLETVPIDLCGCAASTLQRPMASCDPSEYRVCWDRVVQTATLLILEPIFEADFLDCSHGFRPGRNAHGAVDQMRESLEAGRKEVYDADLSSYFDTIPHAKLMELIRRRIVDRSVLSLIRLWLEGEVVETDHNGRKKITKSRKGTPQGGVISPLLANIYLNDFDRAFHEDVQGPKRVANARLVRYADDCAPRRRGKECVT